MSPPLPPIGTNTSDHDPIPAAPTNAKPGSGTASSPPAGGTTGGGMVYAPSPGTERSPPSAPQQDSPQEHNTATPQRTQPNPPRNPSHAKEATAQGPVQEAPKRSSSPSTGELPVHPTARGASSGAELSPRQVETLVRTLLAETQLIARSLENPSGFLRFASTAVSSSLMSQAATASRGATGSLDRSFHGVFQMLGSAGRTEQLSLPP